MSKRLIFIFLLLFYTLFSLSCKKNEDSNIPEIFVIKPLVNTNFNTFDTILVSADLTDDIELTSVTVEILNTDLVSVVKAYGKNISGKEYKLNAALVIDNIHLTSGKHYLLITARDSRNNTLSFTEITIFGLPYETLGYISFENNGQQSEARNYYQNIDSIILLENGNSIGGLVDNYNQQIGLLKSPDGPFKCYPLSPFGNYWDIESIQGGINFCRAQRDKSTIQLGFTDQITSFYQGEGILKRSFNSDIQYSPLLSLDHEENIIIWQKAPGQGSDRLEVFFQSGALKQVTSYNKSVVALEPKDDEHIYVISNADGNAYLDIYNINTGVFLSQSQSIEDHIFYDACVGGSGNLYISSSTGIKKYNPTLLNFGDFSSIISDQIAWDLNGQVLLTATESELILISPSGIEISSNSLHGECIELSVWYSK